MDPDSGAMDSEDIDDSATRMAECGESLHMDDSSDDSKQMEENEGLLDDGESFSARNSDEEDEAADILGEMGLDNDQLKAIEQSKQQGMFVSAWEEDETGVEAKNLTDPNEQFLTAAEEGDTDTLKKMVSINPDFVKVRDKDEYTPLHRAAYNNHVEAAKLLLEKGADPEARTSDGWTVLHSASAWANFEIVGLLISAGVNVNALTNGLLHPLHLAVNSQEDPDKAFDTVRYLLQAPGVDASVPSAAGDSPMAIARRSSSRLFQLLEKHFEKI